MCVLFYVGPHTLFFSIHTTLDQSIIFQFIFQHHTNVPTRSTLSAANNVAVDHNLLGMNGITYVPKGYLLEHRQSIEGRCSGPNGEECTFLLYYIHLFIHAKE
jgi:hypothetical protein